MPTPPATVAEFKAHFDRDFIFGPGLEAVRDVDITRAQIAALSIYNGDLWDNSNGEDKLAFNLATAYLLDRALQAAGGLSPVNKNQGPQNHGSGIVAGKSVGGVSLTYDVSGMLARHPGLSFLSLNDYGAQYLLMLEPRLVGNIFVAPGPRDPDVAIPNIPFIGP